MLYFAYGSNMDFTQMQDRCSSAKFLCVAKLAEHRLAFTRLSKNRGCGVSDAVASKGDSVWGVVYEVSENDMTLLDGSEGFQVGRPKSKNSYNCEQIQVWRDGEQNQPMLVWIYLGNPQPNPPLPNAEYKNLLVNGATHWGLPASYIEQLKRIKISE
jgi:gamma-glutamylcyclotransferase